MDYLCVDGTVERHVQRHNMRVMVQPLNFGCIPRDFDAVDFSFFVLDLATLHAMHTGGCGFRTNRQVRTAVAVVRFDITGSAFLLGLTQTRRVRQMRGTLYFHPFLKSCCCCFSACVTR